MMKMMSRPLSDNCAMHFVASRQFLVDVTVREDFFREVIKVPAANPQRAIHAQLSNCVVVKTNQLAMQLDGSGLEATSASAAVTEVDGRFDSPTARACPVKHSIAIMTTNKSRSL